MKSQNGKGWRVVLTSHGTEGEVVHAGLFIVSALGAESARRAGPAHHQLSCTGQLCGGHSH